VKLLDGERVRRRDHAELFEPFRVDVETAAADGHDPAGNLLPSVPKSQLANTLALAWGGFLMTIKWPLPLARVIGVGLYF
jgi:hypothetical protein